MGQRKKGGRQEPRFGPSASLDDVRPTRPAESDDKPAAKPTVPKSMARKKVRKSEDDEAPRSRKSKSSGARTRFSFGRAMYWAAVLSLWLVIAGAGVVVWVGAHLPAIHA